MKECFYCGKNVRSKTECDNIFNQTEKHQTKPVDPLFIAIAEAHGVEFE